MRNKFTDLINQGVASFKYTPIAPEMPEQDYVCRAYNNIWSIPSDTHMHLNQENGERYITGHMVGIDEKWNRFVCAPNWGAVTFNTTGYWSLCEFLQRNGLYGEKSVLNGDVVYVVKPIPADLENTCSCPSSCCTTESRIPQPIAVLSQNYDSFKVMECFDNKSNLYDVCESLNNNRYVKGDKWTVCEGKLVCPIGNKVYIL